MEVLMISFICSTYQSPNFLIGLINSLLCQTDPDFECLIMDEGDNKQYVPNDLRFKHYHFDRIWMKHTDGRNRGSLGLLPSDKGIELATGDFVCFPCEDIYYAPKFNELMKLASKQHRADFVHCDFVFGLENYTYRKSEPSVGLISRCNWIVKKDKIGQLRFANFMATPQMMGIADGLFVEHLIKSGIKHVNISNILMVYN